SEPRELPAADFCPDGRPPGALPQRNLDHQECQRRGPRLLPVPCQQRGWVRHQQSHPSEHS
ncbi:unnamed protein product, partial [Candidula unifasciata]